MSLEWKFQSNVDETENDLNKDTPAYINTAL